GSSDQNLRAKGANSPMKFVLLILIVPNRLVKQLLHFVKVAIKKALKRLTEKLLGYLNGKSCNY
ncbi:hypothetical protein, partial [Lactobacillus intestinalis]|uniref:hypothetical protein n=1 Tax=Lactobacillus intestinalis TaxID=151781 RepID=UPI0025A0BED5